MKPWMDNVDISKIESIMIKKLSNKGIVNILEWGAGGSTFHFSKHLIKHGIKYNWTSVEYNKKWCDKIVALNLPNVDVKLFDVGNDNLKQRNTNMDDYVNYPKTLNKKFDMILVDGRKRRRCLLEAVNLIKDDGFVLLHDAERTYYHCAFNAYGKSSMITRTLWEGEK